MKPVKASTRTATTTTCTCTWSYFRRLYYILGIIGDAIVILTFLWVFFYSGGLCWSSRPHLQFNWHPLLMIIGMIHFHGNCKRTDSHQNWKDRSFLTLVIIVVYSRTDLSWIPEHRGPYYKNCSCFDIWIDNNYGDYCILGGLWIQGSQWAKSYSTFYHATFLAWFSCYHLIHVPGKHSYSFPCIDLTLKWAWIRNYLFSSVSIFSGWVASFHFYTQPYR